MSTVAAQQQLWDCATLADLCKMYQPETITQKQLVDDGRYPVYGANGVMGRYNRYNHENAQLIIGCRGACGSIHFTPPQSWITGNSMVIQPDTERMDLRFLAYFFEGPADLAAAITGAAQPQLTQSSLKPIVVPLPPLDEQKRIVAVLDQAFAALDRAKGNVEVNVSDSGDLPNAWVRDIFDGENDWPVRPLAEVSENLDRQRVPITKADREPGSVPYYGASGVVDYVKDYLFDEELLLVSEDGANLLMRTYPIAFSIAGKSWVNNHAHVLRFGHLATQEFVRLYLNSISLKPYVTGMAQPKLNQAALNAIPVPVPTLEVQKAIVRKAKEIASCSRQISKRYEAKLLDIASIRESLLQAAFSGQLT